MDELLPSEKNFLPNIPEKKYFKIGEVCRICQIKQHVVRHWETEFKQTVRPKRGPTKQRLYRRVDVESLLLIKKLLKEDGLTIPGARKFLASKKKDPIIAAPEIKRDAVEPNTDFIAELKMELKGIINLIDK